MKNNIALSLIFLLPTLALSGCLGERLISFSNDYYKKSNNMLCIDHSKDIKVGRMTAMREDMIIELQRQNSKTSCALFEFDNNEILTKTTDDRIDNIIPNKPYYFNSNIYKNNGEADTASGFGPNLCFTKKNGDFILHVVNGEDLTNRLADFGCS